MTSCSNIALAVKKFFHTTVGNSAKSDETESQHSLILLKADYKVLEGYDLRNLQALEHDDAIHKCQHCPQALHLRKFCIQAFNLSADRFKYIWEVLKECKCAICGKGHCYNGFDWFFFLRKTTKQSDDDGNKNLPTSDGIDLETEETSLKTVWFGHNSE